MADENPSAIISEYFTAILERIASLPRWSPGAEILIAVEVGVGSLHKS